ncbi:hypothetical protein QKU58_gp153 [Pyramimonas orientalis virus]|uniref:Helicase ATP-binding domain-containing protein n=1 Tax=Pyramimonas orientalis virus 01B TaxID=3134525 RepID=A0A7M4CES0_9VIRU|nr:hypothetical protein QKU58_gp153 [Pyramimonas orientalis virus]QOI90178.1 hypothetical protein HWQ62_00041 [Pyramimonas orientalis virus]
MEHIKSNYELHDYDKKYFVKKNTRGDGDCAYNAFLDSMRTLHPDVKLPSNSKDLRKDLMVYIDNSNDTFKDKQTIIDRIESGIKHHGSGWAENEELEGLALMFGVCIAVWSEIQSLWIYIQHADIPFSLYALNGCKRIVYLINSSFIDRNHLSNNLNNIYSESNQNHGVHYDYLLPKNIFEDNVDDAGSDADSEVQVFVEGDNTNVEDNVDDVGSDADSEVQVFVEGDNTNVEDNVDDAGSDAGSDADSEVQVFVEDGEGDIDDNIDNGEEFAEESIDIEDTDDKTIHLTDLDLEEMEQFKKLTVEKRFENLKRKIAHFDTTQNYEDIQKMLHISSLVKPANKTNRLGEHGEYFVNTTMDYPVDGFTFTKNQKFLKKFMSINTSNAGILLFHGVGVGKTCSSILMAENFVNMFNKKVLVLLPSSLEGNYRKELFDVTKLNYETQSYDSCNGRKYLEMIPNWTKISKVEINKKIQKMINDEYSFYGYLKIVNLVENIRKKSKEKYGKDDAKRNMYIFSSVREVFSNRVIIIDEIHNIRLSNEKSMKKFPKELKFILRCSENVRLVLLSATPMFDHPDEISWIMDFLYMADKHYLSRETKIMFDDEGVITKDSIKRLKYFSKNYVSYMRGYNPETFPVRYLMESSKGINHPKTDMIDKTKIKPIDTSAYQFVFSNMVSQQNTIYQKNEKNISDTKKDIQNRIQLSNIVYPTQDDNVSMSKGRVGFLQNFKIMSEKPLKVAYSSETEFLDTKHLEKYSAKIHNIMENVKSADGLVLIYSKYLYSGLIPCAIALEHMGFAKYGNKNILSKNKQKGDSKGSYIIITADDSLSQNNNDELVKFNDESNKTGGTIRVALINEIAAEGVTFKNVREIHVLEPWYNMNKIEQIIGRGVRYFSHHALKKEERNVAIFLHVNMSNKNDMETIDYRRYRFAIKKQNKITQVENVLKENALDCVLNQHAPISMKMEISDSKGKKRTLLTQYDNVKCANDGKTKNKNLYSNPRMLLFDIIEVSKQVKYVLEQNSIYQFDIARIKTFYDNELLEQSLNHMCRIQMLITINTIKGYLIQNSTNYFFQQKAIADLKITVNDRKQSPRKYISNYVIGVNDKDIVGNADTNNMDNVDTPTATIDKYLEDTLKTMKSNMFSDNKSLIESILIDMIVDRIPPSIINQIPKIKNNQFKDSLKRSEYIIVKDGVVVAFYDMYNNYYKSAGTKNKCNLIINETYKSAVKKNVMKMDEENMLGFIEISTNKDKTLQEPKSKIKHMDNKKNSKKTFGSVCLSTSSITVQMLKDNIGEYESNLDLDKVKKEYLCLLYEYYLRRENRFMRTIEFNVLKN